MDNIFQDLRYGVRMLTGKWGFTFIIALTMALGIGANTAVFSVVNAFLLRPLPYKESDRLARVQSEFNSKELGVSFVDYLDWREQNASFEDMAFFSPSWLANLNFNGETETLPGTLSTFNLFSILGVEPMIGRNFLPEDDQPDTEPVVLLSQGLWARRFGSDPNVTGKKLDIGGDMAIIIGVMPPGFKYPSQSELWMAAGRWFNRENRGVRIDKAIARLKPSVTIEQARAEMQSIAQGLAERFPDTNKDVGASLIAERELWVGEIRPSLLMLLCACGFVLLIACANVANLLLARAGGREKEMAIRAALGAGRLRLIRQLMTESMLLAFIGGASGLLFAMWGLEALVASIPVQLPFWVEMKIDASALWFTLAVSIFTGLVFGLAPAFHATKLNLNESLKEGSKSSAGSKSRRTRGLLVISEVALALILLVGAGLMIKSFLHLQRVEPGFNPQNALVVGTNFPVKEGLGREQMAVIFDDTLKRIQSLPGVEAVGASSDLPLVGQETWDRMDFTIEGQSLEDYKRNPLANWQSVNPDYFRAMGIPLIKGRFFTEQDAINNSGATIINRSMAERYWPEEDPIGKRIKMGEPDSNDRTGTVVGVVGDVKHNGILQEAGFDLYGPYRSPWKEMHIVVRAKGNPMDMAAAVRKEIWSVSGDLGINEVLPLSQMVEDSIWQPRLWGMILAVFSVIALMLASAGIYGVISYAVSQRTREMGIRMALGAQAGDVLKLVLTESLILIFAGVVIGLIGAFALTGMIATQLYGVSATDPAIFAVVSLLLVIVAIAASLVPARRATKVDPMVALRHE